jgi:hypothetical protein
VTGNLVLTLGAVYLAELTGTTVGSQYDQTIVNGSIGLGDATLSLQLGFTPNVGDNFILIRNNGSNDIGGAFQGLPEGASLTADGKTFMISYHGGDGNDVALTSVIPEPMTSVLLLGSAVAFLLKRRHTQRDGTPRTFR